MKSMHFYSLMFIFVLASHARAESFQGILRVAGPSYDREVKLTEKSGLNPQFLCKSAITNKISTLSGFTLNVEGSIDNNHPRKCIIPNDFSVLKTTAGREPYIGILSENKSEFLFIDQKSSQIHLKSVPNGLKALTGKKVILDLKKSPANGSHLVVVTYRVFPE